MSPVFSVPAIPLTEAVWNLLAYNSFQEYQNDPDINFLPGSPPVRGIQVDPGLTVTQFQTVDDNFYWVMVTCHLDDPTTWKPNLALGFLTGPKWLYHVNPTFIRDLENLSVQGFFTNGLPLP